MVDMYIIKDFYFINKELVNSTEIPHSLSARNIKWISKWKGPTGDEYTTPAQLALM